MPSIITSPSSVSKRTRERSAIADLLSGCELPQRAALEALHHQHVRGAQRRIRLWDPNRPVVTACGGCGSDSGHVLSLDPQVELLPERVCEAVREVDRPHSPTPARRALQTQRQSIDDVQIPGHDSLDARPANFDHYLFTGVERGRG
jgi:hypothetical protein